MAFQEVLLNGEQNECKKIPGVHIRNGKLINRQFKDFIVCLSVRLESLCGHSHVTCT